MSETPAYKNVEAIDLEICSVSDLLTAMAKTAYQGHSLAAVMGLAGSMSTAGQWKPVRSLIERRQMDVLVSTDANIAEDIIKATGHCYLQGTPQVDDSLFLASWEAAIRR